MVWTTLDLSSDAVLAEASAFCRSVAEKSAQVHLRYDLEWIVATEGRRGVTAFIDRDTPAFGVGFRQARPLRFCLGEVPFFKKRLDRIELAAGPVVACGPAGADVAASAERAFLTEVGRHLGPDASLSIEGIPTKSRFYELIRNDREMREQFVLLPMGKPFFHHFARLPGSFDEYLRQLSPRSRRSIRYSRNALRRECDGDFSVVCYDTEELVERLLDDTIEVSKKTYQWRLLGLGIRDREKARAAFQLAAKRGWLRCYLLYCKTSPVAFMIGYQYMDCFYYIDVGYDPAWAKFSVGSVLQWEVMADLYRRADTPSMFDFSTGHGPHKSRFGKCAREEANLLLLPVTPSNRLLAASWQATNALSDAAIRTLDRLGLKMPLKTTIRRLATTRGDPTRP